MVNELGPRESWELLQRDPGAVLVDVRTTMEFLFVGHPIGAINIPWLDEQEWTVNPEFVPRVRKLLLSGAGCDGAQCPPLVLICRSGHRSREAAEALLQAGFGNVHNVREGFEGDLDEHHHRGTLGGWRFHGLPWEQS